MTTENEDNKGANEATESTGNPSSGAKDSKAKANFKTAMIWIGGFFAVGSSIAGFFADGMSAVKEIAQEEVSQEVVSLQASINSQLEGHGDVAVPVDCMPSDEAILRPLSDAAGLLAGGKAGSKRPQDADALKGLSAQVESNPENPVFWSLLAKAHLFNGSEAQEVVKYAKISESQCEAWAYPQNLIGNANLVSEQYVDAEVAYRSALTKAADYAAPRFNIALISLKQQKYDAAIGQLDALLEKHAHHKNAHLLRAQAHLGLGNLEKAGADAKGAIERDDNNANAHVLYGQVLHKQGSTEEGMKSLCRAKALGHPAGAKLCPDEAGTEEGAP